MTSQKYTAFQTKGLRSNRRTLFILFQVAKDPMSMCAFDWHYRRWQRQFDNLICMKTNRELAKIVQTRNKLTLSLYLDRRGFGWSRLIMLFFGFIWLAFSLHTENITSVQ